MSLLTEVTDATFDELVLRAERPTLVDCWAEWCSPCRTMLPILEQLAQEQAGKLNIVKLDVQAQQETAIRLGILNLPSLLLFVGGEEKERLGGFMPLVKIMDKIKPYLPA
jgi:thioredoxin 1